MQKRVAGNWLLASTIIVSAFLLTTLLYLIIFVPLYVKGFPVMNTQAFYSNTTVQILGEICQTFTLWLGAVLGCRYVLKTYTKFNSKMILKLSTYYMVLFVVLNFVSGVYIIYPDVSVSLIVIYILGDIAACLAIYFAVKRHLLTT